MMRPALITFALVSLVACRSQKQPDAYGNFEAEEVTVSAQTSGQLLTFEPTEGAHLDSGRGLCSMDLLEPKGSEKRGQAAQGVLRAERLKASTFKRAGS